MSTLQLHHSADLVHRLTHTVSDFLTHRVTLTQEIVEPRPLQRGCTFWVTNPRGRLIRCLEGTLWLTVDGCSKDFILEAGETQTMEHASPLAIHALADSKYLLS